MAKKDERDEDAKEEARKAEDEEKAKRKEEKEKARAEKQEAKDQARKAKDEEKAKRKEERDKAKAEGRIPPVEEIPETEGAPVDPTPPEDEGGGAKAHTLTATEEPPEEIVEGEGTGGTPPGVRPADEAKGPTTPTDEETKEVLRSIREQEKRRSAARKAEAKELRRRAEELEKTAKREERFERELERHTDVVSQMAPELGLDPDRPVTEIPALVDPDLAEVEMTTIQEDRSYVRILYDRATSRYHYQVIEPRLTETEEEVLEFLHDTLVRTLDGRFGHEDWEAHLRDAIARTIVDHSILVDDISRKRLEYYLIRDFLGYGPIDVMMKDPMIEDLSCDGPGIPIYIFHRQYESIRSNVTFETEHELDSFVLKLAQRAGKHISIANPILDATLPDTSRLQATLSREVTTRGSSFTIRKFRTDPLTPPDLIRLGTLSPEMAAYFWMAMEEGNSILFAGGTASGKTTTLNAACQFIPPQKKIVSIEDTREINLEHENWIAALTRTGFGGDVVEGKVSGTVDMYDLLESALRQRPEYLLVGEVRGEEALTLFQAMATGHATYSTVHADSVMSAVYRLENPPINVPRTMLQTLDIMAIQVQARIEKRMVRRIKEITEIVEIDPDTGDLLTNTVFEWDPKDDTYRYLGKSHIFDLIEEKHNLSAEQVVEEWQNRTHVMRWMVEKGIRQIDDVSNVVNAYYSDPEGLLRKTGKTMTPEQEVRE